MPTVLVPYSIIHCFPMELTGYMSPNTWNIISGGIRTSDSQAHLSACGAEACCCLFCGFPLCFCHPCVVASFSNSGRQRWVSWEYYLNVWLIYLHIFFIFISSHRKCMELNRLLFGGRNVLSTTNTSIVVNTDYLAPLTMQMMPQPNGQMLMIQPGSGQGVMLQPVLVNAPPGKIVIFINQHNFIRTE